MARVKPREIKVTQQEQKIKEALEERRLKGTSFRDLVNKFGIPHSTLCDRANGGKTRREAHEWQPVLPAWVERGLEQWAAQMDASGFPPRLDLLRVWRPTLPRRERTKKTTYHLQSSAKTGGEASSVVTLNFRLDSLSILPSNGLLPVTPSSSNRTL